MRKVLRVLPQFAGARQLSGLETVLHRKQRLLFPLKFSGPVAILEEGFKRGRNQRMFRAPDYVGLEEYCPEVLAASLDTVLVLADEKRRGRLSLSSVQTALVVFTTLDDSPLEDSHRDILWNTFGVPVFEQLRNAEGKVIARECEVHDGLHIDAGTAIPEHACEVLLDPCECGADTSRLKPMVRTGPFATAASA
jgi:hypothetical protein